MLKIFTLIFVVMLVSPALYASELKIAVFDIQQILRESAKVQEYRNAIFKEIDTKRTQLLQKETQIKNLEQRLKTDDKLSPAQRKNLEEKLLSELKDYSRQKEDIEADIKRKDRELTEQALSEISKIISDLATKNAYAIVFERHKAGIVHLQPSVDITKQIIQLYDRR